ncbi:MAG TPA: hypothetical protein VLV29_09055, partial [Steroidobacteraceae bacterium]|nr:hypothetical protein [Steroidobacteraceae bacterium]
RSPRAEMRGFQGALQARRSSNEHIFFVESELYFLRSRLSALEFYNPNGQEELKPTPPPRSLPTKVRPVRHRGIQ